MDQESIDEAARQLSDAWSTGQQIIDLPEGLKPESWDDVYRIQDATIARRGSAIGAWKVAPVDRGSGRICVPIPADLIHVSPATITASAFAPLIEVEVAARLGRDLPGSAGPYTAADMAEAVAALHLAVEVAGSRFVDRKAVGQMTAVADLGMNAGIVIGPALADWRAVEVGGLAARLTAGEAEVATSPGGWTTAEMLEALADLANHAARRTGGLKAGQVVITGARIGPVETPLNATVEAAGAGFRPVRLSLR